MNAESDFYFWIKRMGALNNRHKLKVSDLTQKATHPPIPDTIQSNAKRPALAGLLYDCML